MSTVNGKQRQKLKPAQVGLMVGIMAVYLIIPTQNIPNVIMNDLVKMYPTLSAGTLSYFLTIANIASMVGAFFFGLIAGRRFKSKTVTVVALLCYIVGGGLPMLMPNHVSFGLLMATRFVLGLGLGCFMPMVQSTIVKTFEDEASRSAWLGIGGIFFNVGAALGSSIAGALALISWQTVFAFYLIGVIPLALFVVFYKEPQRTVVEENTEKKTKVRVPSRVWLLLIPFMLSCCMTQMFVAYGPIILGEMNVNPAIFGTMMSVLMIGATVVAAVFALCYKTLKNHVLTVGLVLESVSFLALYLFATQSSAHLVGFYISLFVLGFGMNLLTVGMAMVLSTVVSPAVVAFVLGLNFVFQNLGSFLGSPLSQLYFAMAGPKTPVNSIFLATAVLGVVLTVYTAIVVVSTSKKKHVNDMPTALESVVTN
ncbi:MAG: MFS transporter [Coriobacteriia bacterium]